MQSVIMAMRLVLSAVFGVAGVAKLLDRRGTREAVLNFGAPASFVASIVILLPLSELAVAVTLLPGQTAWWGALGALLLLCVFITVIGLNLQQGRTPECHCFGQLYSRPLGWPTLVRNIGFAICAGFVVWRGPSSAGQSAWLFLQEVNASHSRLAVRGSVSAAVVIGIVFLVYLRQRRSNVTAGDSSRDRGSSSTDGLPVDSVAPQFELAAYDGGSMSLQGLLNRKKAVMLIFTNPNCGPCVTLFREVGEWQRTYSETLTIAVVSQGTVKENFVNTARNRLQNVLLQAEREVAEVYRAKVTPTALVVLLSGKIGSDAAAGADEIRNLMQSMIQRDANLTSP
jgi:uncharacterized membrane protein YphA (DoxX/SURF4 family)/peroxiredoxin